MQILNSNEKNTPCSVSTLYYSLTTLHVGLDYNYYNLLYINYIYTTIFKEPDNNIAEDIIIRQKHQCFNIYFYKITITIYSLTTILQEPNNLISEEPNNLISKELENLVSEEPENLISEEPENLISEELNNQIVPMFVK